MKCPSRMLLPLLTLTLIAEMRPARADANPGFERLTALVGEWDGKDTEDKSIRVTFRLASGGTSLVESLSAFGEADKVSIYTRDRDEIALTPNAGDSSQPPMHSVPNALGNVELDFSDSCAANRAVLTAGHMHRLVINFQDIDHFTEEWTWREHGKGDRVTIFRFSRILLGH